MKILIVTGCGASKHNEPREAYRLYKSSRIKAVYNRKMNCDMCILSAKYGLIDAEKIIMPYDQIMDEIRAKELITDAKNKIKKYDCVILYAGGTKFIYKKLIRDICMLLNKPLYEIGYALNGDINQIESTILKINEEFEC